MSSQHDGRESRRFGEHVQEQAKQQHRRSQEDRLQEAVEAANKALTTNDYLKAGSILADVIIPLLRDREDARPMSEYHRELSDDDRYPWHWSAFSRFRNQPDRFLDAVASPQVSDVKLLASYSAGSTPRSESARKVIWKALESAESITSYHQITQDGMRNRVDASGFAVKVGEHLQQYDMDFPDPVPAVTRQFGALKHFYTGGTGSGKSVGADRQAEDYYRASIGNGRDYKVLDPVELSSTENAVAYDVGQRQDSLREAREEHGLPPSWDDAQAYIEDEYGVTVERGAEYPEDSDVPEAVWEVVAYTPEAELFVPLSPDLEDYPLPYDTDAESWVPTPFTIPASEISESLMVAVLQERAGRKEERAIREAYREVNSNHADWSLSDLASAIGHRDDLNDSTKQSTIKLLSNLEAEGVIRTADDPHTLDWHQLFTSTNRITRINQAPVRDELTRYFIAAHLIDQIWSRRIRSHNTPPLILRLRELWELVPHREFRRKMDDAVQAVVEFTIDRLLKIQRKPRDINTHVVADTQNPSDVEKGIRTRFNRYVVFGGSNDEIKDVFKWASQNNWQGFTRTLTGKPGHAGVIKGCDPAIGNPYRYGIAPVHLTPPSWHCHDKNEGPSGFQKRADLVDDEELRLVAGDWATDPPSTAIDEDDYVGEDAEDDDEDDDDDELTTKQIRMAHRQEARRRNRHGESLREIRNNLPNNPERGKPYGTSTIGNWTKDVDKGAALDDDE